MSIPLVMQVAGASLGQQLAGDSWASTALACCLMNDRTMAPVSDRLNDGIFTLSAVQQGRGLLNKFRPEAAVAQQVQTKLESAAEVLAGAQKSAAVGTVYTAENLTLTQLGKTMLGKTFQAGQKALGPVAFGANAVEVCQKEGFTANCAIQLGFTFVTAAHAVLPEAPVVGGVGSVQNGIKLIDVGVNAGLVASACSAAAYGQAPEEGCTTALMFAAMSANTTCDCDPESLAEERSKICDPAKLAAEAKQEGSLYCLIGSTRCNRKLSLKQILPRRMQILLDCQLSGYVTPNAKTSKSNRLERNQKQRSSFNSELESIAK